MLDKLRVDPSFRLSAIDTRDKLGIETKEHAVERLAALNARLAVLQARLAAESERALLVVLQAMDAGGKDGTIRSVFTGLNPQGVRVTSFKAPAGREAAMDYLWRVHDACPAAGEIGIFNRSHYEDVVVTRVRNLIPEGTWRRRFRHIREFERMLVDEGTTVVKFFLHISSDEQRQRLQERVEDPVKGWKFRMGDLEDRARWPAFMEAYEDALRETSTAWAPWYVVPADRNWVRNLAVAEVLVALLERLDPQLPSPDPAIRGLTVE
ncbi:MAG: polyphosphate kinase 2 family protein [Acidimicrobiales bacterium]